MSSDQKSAFSRVLLTAVLIFSIGSPTRASDGAPFGLTVATDFPTYALGSIIRVFVTITNIGNSPLTIDPEPFALNLTVYDEHGENVPNNVERELPTWSGLPQNQVIRLPTLQPGGSFAFPPLTTETLGFHPTRRGSYRFVISQAYRAPMSASDAKPRGGFVTSNEALVSIR
jgi:hypothetical protein